MYESPTAADLKPDLANAYYNASAAYREKNDYAKAYAAMQNAVNLVKKDSPDYPKAADELASLQKKLNAQVAGAKTETPSKAPTVPAAKPQTQIELPSDLGPNITPTTTAPLAPEASPTP